MSDPAIDPDLDALLGSIAVNTKEPARSALPDDVYESWRQTVTGAKRGDKRFIEQLMVTGFNLETKGLTVAGRQLIELAVAGLALAAAEGAAMGGGAAPAKEVVRTQQSGGMVAPAGGMFIKEKKDARKTEAPEGSLAALYDAIGGGARDHKSARPAAVVKGKPTTRPIAPKLSGVEFARHIEAIDAVAEVSALLPKLKAMPETMRTLTLESLLSATTKHEALDVVTQTSGMLPG